MFCKHKWSIVSETITESKFQHAIKIAPEATMIPKQMAQAERKFIQVITCDKCGKLKRFVESI